MRNDTAPGPYETADAAAPFDAFAALRQAQDQLCNLRQVVAALAGGLGYYVGQPADLPDLDLGAVVEMLRTAYRSDLTRAETDAMCARSLRRSPGGAR